jgi:hypothetical protein
VDDIDHYQFAREDPKSQLFSYWVKLDCDLANFLCNNHSQNTTWWSMCELYRKTNFIFKSLCEGNCQEFKKTMGQFEPQLDSDESPNKDEVVKTIVSLKIDQMIF